MARQIKKETLEYFRRQLLAAIEEDYDTIEQFCWDKDLSKATISNILNNKKDFSVSTLEKIAKALDMELIIKLKK
jgi:transcriptional regulator with XRE-family HTH domain